MLNLVEKWWLLPAVSFIFIKMKAPAWLGEYSFPCASTQASPLDARTILYGTFFLLRKEATVIRNVVRSDEVVGCDEVV